MFYMNTPTEAGPVVMSERYESMRFGAQLTELFGPGYTWAELRHPRANHAILEIGTGPDRSRAIWRRINPDGVMYIKSAENPRLQVWRGEGEFDAFDASRISAQFALLQVARRDAPLTHGRGCLFARLHDVLEPML